VRALVFALLLIACPAWANNTLYMRAQWPAATPTPTPTPRPTSVVLSSSNSSVCGVDDRFFGNGSACNATETSVDVPASESGTFTSMSCTQPTDSTCTLGFTLRNGAADVSTFYCESVNNSTCSPSSPTPTSFSSGNLLAIKTTDVTETCASNAPTCTVFYTVP